MKKSSLKEKFEYRFDNFMAAGSRSIFLTLVLLFFAAFIFTGILRMVIHFIFLTPKKGDSVFTDVWLSFLQITDPGAVGADDGSHILLKLVAIVTIFLGLIFFSTVIAFITTQLEKKIELLKKGKSMVLEKDHVLILGWGEMVVDIIRELIEANVSGKKKAVVVLSETPKQIMDDYLYEHIPHRKTTKIITRSGKSSSMEELNRVSVTESKSVIILPLCNEAATEEEKMTSDAKVLKSILAVVAASREDPSRANIIAEIYDKTKRHVMTNLDPEFITMVDTETIIAQIIVQTSRTTGLAFVYNDIIGFEGSEIYYYNAPWNGRRFGELPFHFPDGIPIGIRSVEKTLSLNPSPEYTLKEDDEIVIIAEDDSKISYKEKTLYSPMELPFSQKRLKKTIEKELIIGWNSKTRKIIEEYTDYILPGSVIDIVLPPKEKEGAGIVKRLQKKYPKIKMKIIQCNPLMIKDLEKARLEKYDNVILLTQADDDTEKIDSTTITTLLLIKEIFSVYEKKTGTVVTTQLITEVMNSENLELVVKTGVNDSIITYKMVSKILAQLAENPNILMVYNDLFSEAGSEIYLKSPDLYIKELPETMTVADIIALVQKRGELFIGYRFKEQEFSVPHNFGVSVNPPKDMIIHPVPEDRLIVLAEDER
ncbi:MAG: hypothetical protein GY754_26635 [bacterium]|nr:hypothetical protein [bacterium]